MASIQSLTVKIGANIAELTSAMSKVQSSVQKTGERMSQLGKTISTRVTAPLTALAGVAVRSFGIQEKAEFKLRAALQANGREVDRLFTRYNAFAQEMQRVTVVGDETTLSMLQQAESLGLTADNAERAVKNAISLGSATNMSAESALRYTSALEHGNATMLRRHLPALREMTDESEMVSVAQDELAKMFSIAEAEAQTFSGQLAQMRGALGDLMEVVGGVVAEAILPFVTRIKELAEQAQNVNKETIQLGVAIAGVATAIGPTILVLGKLAGAIGMLLNPIGLTIIAIGTLITLVVRNFDTIRTKIVEIANAWIELYNESALVRGIFQSIITVFGIVYDGIKRQVKDIITMFKGLGNVIIGAFTLNWDRIKEGYSDAFKGILENAQEQIDNSKERIQNAIEETFTPKKPIEFITEEDVDNQLRRVGEFVNKGKSLLKDFLFTGSRAGGAVAETSTGRMRASFQGVKEPVDDIIDITDELGESLEGFGDDVGLVDGSINKMNHTISQFREMMNNATDPETVRIYQQEIEILEQRIDELRGKTNNLSNAAEFANAIANDFTSSFGQGMANVIVQGERLVDVLKNIGKLLVSSAIQKGLQTLLTGGLGGAGFFGSGGGLIGSLKSIFVDDALITSNGQVVKFHPDDNILAMKDFSNLGGGTQKVEVFGTIKGEDIFISSERGGNAFAR